MGFFILSLGQCIGIYMDQQRTVNRVWLHFLVLYLLSSIIFKKIHLKMYIKLITRVQALHD